MKVVRMFLEELNNLKKFFDEIEFGKKYYKNIVLVSHACFFRAFAMNILYFPVDTFHRIAKT